MSWRFARTKQLLGLAVSFAVGFLTTARVDGGDLIWFTNQAAFEAFSAKQGEVFKGTEDYEESVLGPNGVAAFDDPLESGVPNLPDGFPFPAGITGLPNLIVQSNLGGGIPTEEDPRGVDGLAAAAEGFNGAVSDIVIANFLSDSLDLIFTQGKSGVGFNTVNVFGGPFVEIRVYSTTNVLLGEMLTFGDPFGTFFIGVWSPDPIGRINIWDLGSGAEGGDNIQAWDAGSPPCPWDLDDTGAVGISDLLDLLANWGPCKGCPADFDENGSVGISDLLALLANWGPCQ